MTNIFAFLRKVVSTSACQSLGHFHQRGETHGQPNKIAKVHDCAQTGVPCFQWTAQDDA